MKYVHTSHRNAYDLFLTQRLRPIWNEIHEVITNISDKEIIERYKDSKQRMSISNALNTLLKDKFSDKKWMPEAPIFKPVEYQGRGNPWRLDFAKETVSVEVSYNHGEALCWNFLKPVLASEVNPIEKAIQTEIGVVITVTKSMKQAGAFDSAVGHYEKAKEYLVPLRNYLTVPILLIGLEAPESFRVDKVKAADGKNDGVITML